MSHTENTIIGKLTITDLNYFTFISNSNDMLFYKKVVYKNVVYTGKKYMMHD